MSFIKTKNGKIFAIKGISAENPIIAQTDNLAELCEVFCVKNSVFSNLEDAKKFKKHLKEEQPLQQDYTLYGGVWTNWGMKYIGKLDSKGEWTLI